MKKVNFIILWIFILIGIDAGLAATIPFSTSIYTDITKLVAEVFHLALVIYLFINIKKRKPFVLENKTISDLIFAKENSRKIQNIPVSMLILVMYSLLIIASMLPEILWAYLNYFNK